MSSVRVELDGANSFDQLYFSAGVTIPHTLGADAHSDGDAVYHRSTQQICDLIH